MQVRFLSKLSLFIMILALPQFVTSTSTSQSLLCSSVLAADTKSLGDSGDNGDAGIKGSNGRNSDNLTVFADGESMTLDLTGGDGAAGGQGIKGDNAACEQPTEPVGKNLRGADGGNGGDGGDGGVGGNGGSLTVYTTNKEHLKQIYVIAAGGEGGAPGKAGVGGKVVNAIALIGMKKLAMESLEVPTIPALLKSFNVSMVTLAGRDVSVEKVETAKKEL